MSNPSAHLNSAPIDGTVIETLPSNRFWEFHIGGWLAVSSLTSSTAVTDASLSTYPFDASPSINSASSASVVVGVPGSFSISATGFPVPVITETGALPTGMSFSNGSFSGSPAPGSAATYPITISASNGISPDATQSFTLTVRPIGITTTSLPSGSIYTKTNKVTYSVTLAVSGGNPPYKWSLVVASSLPPGLKLSSTGVISGKAKTAGTYSFTVQVVDTKTKAKRPMQNKATAELSITIS